MLWRSSSESFQADWSSFSPWDSVLVLYVQYLFLGVVNSLLLLLGIVVKSYHSSTTISNGIFEICLSFERWGLSKTFSKLTDSTSRLQLLVSSELERKYGLKNMNLSSKALTENWKKVFSIISFLWLLCAIFCMQLSNFNSGFKASKQLGRFCGLRWI